MAYNVLVVEDQMMPRQLFELYIKSDPRFALFGSISNADMAVDICRHGEVDLILMDPDVRIIIVTSMPESSWIEKARSIGVDSFWYKEAQKEPILDVMLRTMEGESIYPDETPLVSIGNASNHDFSERELEVLRELISGDSNAEIGKRLGVAPSTVKFHVQNMLQKTGMHTRTELAAVARSLGIVIR